MVDNGTVRASGLLAVGDGHEIYWEESGNPDGIPAVYLHGGPGGGLGTGAYRNKFDPARFRIIGFDQRGCGRSTPHVTAPNYDLGQNTTPHLIDDIERIREYLHVDRWLVNGASWGSTLALAYAQVHPGRVFAVVAMAVTTTGRLEVDWITETVGAIYPEAWDRLATHAEQAGIGYHRGTGRIIEAYARLMTHEDPAIRDAASRAWVAWEDHHISVGTGGVQPNPRWEDDEFRHVFTTLVTHYWAHDAFLTPPILERMVRLHGIPGTLIHGRRDVSAPAVLPWQLHRTWPGSELIIEESEGHGGTSMVQAWRTANSRHADRIEADQAGA
ncbi:alpha/beta fold hydrolase [Nocardia sp. NPDC051570]|uniref:alpha/beta fold hydrolase n=1 Tax=Nocardia sp. NPDC051570 TaxID=3364324 RepID=UPI0037AA8E1F